MAGGARGKAAPVAPSEGGCEDFPVVRFLCLMAVMLTNCINISFLFPFVGFFVIHLGVAEDKATVGYYAGVVASMFFLGRAVSNFAWGLLADVYGRKPVMLFSLVASAVTMAGFGFSGSFFALCAWRFVAGLLNGISSVTKVVAFEMVSSREHQNRGSAWLQISWGVGLVMGPSVGGYLSEPCSAESDLTGLFQHDSWMCTHPYALPCVVGAVLHGLVLPCWWYLPETAQCRRPLPCSGLLARASSCLAARRYKSVPLPASEGGPRHPRKEKLGPLREKVKEKDLESAKPALQDVDAIKPGFEVASADSLQDTAYESSGPSRSPSELGSSEGAGGRQPPSPKGALREPVAMPAAGAADREGSQPRPRGLCQRRFLQLVCVQSVSVMSLVMCQDLASLWAILPVNRGGPQWSAESIGKSWGVFGVVLLFLQVPLVPWIINTLGNEAALKAGLLTNIIFQVLLPWLALANPASSFGLEGTLRPAPLIFCLFIAVTCAQQFMNQLIVVPIGTLVNASVDVANRARGTGLAMALQSLFMAVSPMVAGVILASTVELAGERAADPLRAWPGGTHPAFLASSALLVVAWLLMVSLPADLEEQKAVGG